MSLSPDTEDTFPVEWFILSSVSLSPNTEDIFPAEWFIPSRWHYHQTLRTCTVLSEWVSVGTIITKLWGHVLRWVTESLSVPLSPNSEDMYCAEWLSLCRYHYHQTLRTCIMQSDWVSVGTIITKLWGHASCRVTESLLVPLSPNSEDMHCAEWLSPCRYHYHQTLRTCIMQSDWVPVGTIITKLWGHALCWVTESLIGWFIPCRYQYFTQRRGQNLFPADRVNDSLSLP